MERFDINKELKNLEGLSVRAKCSALDDLCCTLREAISDISNAPCKGKSFKKSSTYNIFSPALTLGIGF